MGDGRPGETLLAGRALADSMSVAREAVLEALAEAESHAGSSGDTRVYNLLDEAVTGIEAAQAAWSEASR